MFKNYLKITWRNLLRYKSYSLLNLAGLAVGIAAVLLILLSIQFELSFDNFHTDSERLFRISVISTREGQIGSDSHVFTPPIGPDMLREFPEVEGFTRMSTPRTTYLRHDDHTVKVDNLRHADSTFFDLLSFQLLAGNPGTALARPYSVVLTTETARKLFGGADPLGRVITLGDTTAYEVTGVMSPPPANSHLQFNGLISFATLYRDPRLHMDWDGGNQYITYVRLGQAAAAGQVEARLPDFMWRHINEKYANFGFRLDAYLQPFNDIHLFHNPDSRATRTNIIVYGSVAVLILLIACINFVNLTTARGIKRAREVGVRKVLGAGRDSLIGQFLGETVILSLIAFVLAVGLVWLFLPIYAQLMNKDLSLFAIFDFSHLGALLLILVFVGLASGSYPALYLSAFPAIRTLKGAVKTGSARSVLRNTLVVVQFTATIVLLASTILINNQLRLLGNQSLGFDQDNVVVLPLLNDALRQNSAALKREILTLPNIRGAAASSQVPHRGLTSNGYSPEGVENPMMIHVVDVDEDFLAAFEIDVASGRNFSTSFATDASACLINETLARSLGWDDPVGKTIERGVVYRVIGVVEDFHFATLHHVIEPLIVTSRRSSERFNFLSVRLGSGDVSETLAQLRSTWQTVAPGLPFEYYFLDEAVDNLYKAEQRFRGIFLYFSLLAMLIALAGLIGLAAFAAEQRTKEIGIRKILGATPNGIMKLLTGELALLVLVANLIAVPVAWIAMNKWLQDFAIRIDISAWVFVLAGGATLLIAFMAVSFQTVRAALMNPVDTLRYE